MKLLKINEKTKNESSYKILSLILGISFLLMGFNDMELAKIAIGLLLAFYFTYSKHIYLSDKGVIYKYNAFLLNKEEYLYFKDVEEITVISQGTKSSIFFIKDPIAKKIVINNNKLDEITKFIKSTTNIAMNFETR
nr:hypothetical protein [uncultured Aminipila sp.]